MKRNVNPFEPWRPPAAAVPPPIHAARPWRPPSPPPMQTATEEPPFVEAVDPPPPRKKRPKHPPRPKRPQGQAEKPSRSLTPLSQCIPVILLAVSALLCLDSVGWLRGTHLPRLLALGASAALLVVMAFNRRRSWYTRLTGMATALALAGIAAWFVPTVRGVNLWSAYRQVEALRLLPAGEVAEYQRGAAARRILVEEFPSFTSDVSAAEQAWIRRTVDEAVDSADRRLETEPHIVLADLQRLDAALASLEHYAPLKHELEAARRRAVQACAKAARREVEELHVNK